MFSLNLNFQSIRKLAALKREPLYQNVVFSIENVGIFSENQPLQVCYTPKGHTPPLTLIHSGFYKLCLFYSFPLIPFLLDFTEMPYFTGRGLFSVHCDQASQNVDLGTRKKKKDCFVLKMWDDGGRV